MITNNSMRILTLLIASLLLLGGGGTSGTSPTGGSGSKIFRGTITDQSGNGVSGAIVQFAENTTGATTDNLGNFSFDGVPDSVNPRLLVSSGQLRTEIPLSAASKNSSIVSFDITIGESGIKFSDIELTITEIGGDCAGKFGAPKIISFGPGSPPLFIISQLKRFKPKDICEVKVEIRRDGRDEAGQKFQLVSAIRDGRILEQRTLTEATTGSGGKGSLSFAPVRDVDGSAYLVLEAPLDLPWEKRVGIVIDLLQRGKRR